MIALLLLAILPQRTITVDAIELNTVCRDECNPWSQVILWHWNPADRRHEVTDWWIAGDCETPHRLGGYWQILHSGVRIRSMVFSRTTTPHDRELANRQLLPDERRAARL